MSNNMNLQQEGEGETTHNPTDDNSNSDDIKDYESSPDIPSQDNKLIQSNINNVTDDGKDSDSDSDNEFEQDGDNETSHTNCPPKNNTSDNNDNENKNENHNENINNNPNRSNSNNNQSDKIFNKYNIPCIILVVFIAIYIAKYFESEETEPIPICSQIPDPNMKYKLECPKCDAYNNNGKCIIYVPYSAEQYTLDAKGINNELNDYECTNFLWDLDHNHILASGEDTSLLDMTFISAGREDIELTIYINRTDHKTGQLKYYKEKTCDINLIIYEAPFFGIDLGTTYSCIAYQKPYINQTTQKRDTNIVVMDQTKMEYCIPSSVYFDKNKQIYIGNSAQHFALINNDFNNLIYDIKRIIGRPSDDPSLKHFDNTHQFKLNLTNKYPKIIIPNWQNENITPEQLLSVILIELVRIASQQFGIPSLKDVVVSIPAIFHDAQRKAVHSACQIAGLNAKLLVVEPSAASIAHIYYAKMDELTEFNKYFMTLDVGGGTTDVSVLRCTGLHCQVLGVAGNSSLGGIDFDNVIVDIIMDKMIKKLKLTKNEFIENYKILYDEIICKSESVKIALSNEDQIMIRIGSNSAGYYELIITRQEFETDLQTIKLINNIINLVSKAMYDDNPLSTKKGNEQISNIRAILLIGGSVKIPIIKKMLMNTFINNNNANIELIYPSDDPQLMVVKGSAIIGGSMAYTDALNSNILQNQIPNIIIDDVLPMSFGFDVCIIDMNEEDGHKCGIMDILIHKNSKYPTKGEGIYCQKLPTSSTATLMLYEGDNSEVKHNFFLTKLDILNVPNRSEYECNNIKVELMIDENGIANITAKTNDQIFSKQLPVQSNDGHLTDEQISILNKQVISWFDQ